jgi:enamine deaminase RidA (YjgF/YER057c/UK114 family)
MTAPAFELKTFVPARRAGNFLFVSGQLPLVDGRILTPGTVGDTVTLEQASDAAKVAAQHCLAVLENELGSLDQVESVIKLNGYVASAPGFTAQATVVDAASRLILSTLGDAGIHARLSIGVASLPLGAPVEIELIVAVK